MLVTLPATTYTCNGVWYNQPSSTERFWYVLLLASLMRRLSLLPFVQSRPVNPRDLC